MEDYKMATKKCIKCGSENLYRGWLKGFDVGVGSKWGFSTYKVETEVCLDCGYVELYLNEKDLEKLKKKLKK